MEYYVGKNNIVREIWGKADTVLFIFAGASAEFALNKAVDWLYFTGKLPADPLGRLFSTVSYARQIVFSEHEAALTAIDKITAIHKHVESARGDTIPMWAYRDVLFMLINYSISAYEVLERKLNDQEKDDVYQVFYRLGERMYLEDLPKNYKEWLPVRQQHMEDDLARSRYTDDLFIQYRKHLGGVRYRILIEGQKLVVPPIVADHLRFNNLHLLKPVVAIYKLFRLLGISKVMRNLLMPQNYLKQINDLDVA